MTWIIKPDQFAREPAAALRAAFYGEDVLIRYRDGTTVAMVRAEEVYCPQCLEAPREPPPGDVRHTRSSSSRGRTPTR